MQQNEVISQAVLELPILKHFDQKDIAINPAKWRSGEKAVAIAVAMAATGVIAWGAFAFVLPFVFTAIGRALGAFITATSVIGFFILLPVIIKGWRRLSRYMHRLLIKFDPFAELEDQRQKMIGNKEQFKMAKAKIRSIKNSMQMESSKSENDSKKYQDEVIDMQQKAEILKRQMTEMEQKKGAAAKDSDEYVEKQTELMKVLSRAQRLGQQLKQSTDLISKYGSRAHVIGKLERKLNLVETAMEIKVSDFETSIEMLRKEYDFANAAKSATEQAKSVMNFSEGWELEYALDVVQNTIALDLATTHINLSDLDSMTSQYSMDSDELYAQLDKLADKIKTGDILVPEAKKYSSPNYKMTEQDKLNSGGFQDIF